MGYNDRYRPANIGGKVSPGPSKVLPVGKSQTVERPIPAPITANAAGRGGFDQLRAASLECAASGQPNGDAGLEPGEHAPLTY